MRLLKKKSVVSEQKQNPDNHSTAKNINSALKPSSFPTSFVGKKKKME